MKCTFEDVLIFYLVNNIPPASTMTMDKLLRLYLLAPLCLDDFIDSAVYVRLGTIRFEEVKRNTYQIFFSDDEETK